MRHPPIYPNREPVPAAVRQSVLRRANLACEDCGSSRPLEMHHLRYRRDDGALIFGGETPGDLDALCRDCHLGRHLDLNGEYWADPEDKESHWAGWAEEMAKP